MKFKESFNTIIWIVITAVISIAIERSCNRIIPEEPLVIKEISDTVKLVHGYDFGDIDDSLINKKIEDKLRRIELTHKYESEILKQNKNVTSPNTLMLEASFPNAKGYAVRNAAPYFTLKISPLDQEFIDFNISFIDKSILSEIYCLTLKVYQIVDGNHVGVLDESYHVHGEHNLIRIANTLPEGRFEFSVGFTFKKDRELTYPDVHMITKIITK